MECIEMPIKGLTDRGLAFPVIGQIRKGAPKGEKAPGKDLDYFRVVFDEEEGDAQAKFVQVYTAQPKEINILLPFNDLDRMWSAWLEAYTAGQMVARSDGAIVTYRKDTKTGELAVFGGVNVKTGEIEKYTEGLAAGWDYQSKPVYYKAVGRLKLIVPELMRAAYLLLLTSSKFDIMHISEQLLAYQELTNGNMAGVPFTLRRRPVKISVPMGTREEPGKRTRMVKHLLSIEIAPHWVERKLFQLSQSALPTGEIKLLGEAIDVQAASPDEPEDEPEEQEELDLMEAAEDLGATVSEIEQPSVPEPMMPEDDEGIHELAMRNARNTLSPKGVPLGELDKTRLMLIKAQYENYHWDELSVEQQNRLNSVHILVSEMEHK
jgi:hypothetical protein